MEKARKKELLAEFRQTRPAAGVYRIVNRQTGRALLASTENLQVVRNRLDFAQSSKGTSLLDRRLVKDAREQGIEVFALEVLEVLEVTPEMTDAQVKADLAALESLWREKQDQALAY